MSDEIPEDKFELYEVCIISGQVPAEDVPDLLKANPKFDAWYRNRIQLSAARAVPSGAS